MFDGSAVSHRWQAFEEVTKAVNGWLTSWAMDAESSARHAAWLARAGLWARHKFFLRLHRVVNVEGNAVPLQDLSVLIAQRLAPALRPAIGAIFSTPAIVHDEGVAGLDAVRCPTLHFGSVFGMNQLLHHSCEILEVRLGEAEMVQKSLADV